MNNDQTERKINMNMNKNMQINSSVNYNNDQKQLNKEKLLHQSFTGELQIQNFPENNLKIQIHHREKYQPYRIPPILELCHRHRICTQFGSPKIGMFLKELLDDQKNINNQSDSEKSNKSVPKCNCCGEEQKQLIPINCNIKQIYNVSEVVGFYFSYIKVICLMLLLMIISVGIYSLIKIAQNCQTQNNCIYVYGVPISKIHVFFTQILTIMNGVIVLLMYGIIVYLYYLNASVHSRMLFQGKKPSDYSVLITGVDHQKITGPMLRDYFHDFKIDYILYTHKIQNYTKMLHSKSHLQAKKNLFYKKGHDHKLKKIQRKIRQVQDGMISIKNKMNMCQQITLRTDKIIIKFKSIQEKQKFDLQFRQTMSSTIVRTFCGGSLITINQIPLYVQTLGEPHEIVWQNLQVSSKNRYLRVLGSNIITLIILGVSYILVVFLSNLQQHTSQTNDIILSIAFSIIIQTTNFVLDITIQKLTDWQRRYTLTGKYNTMIIKSFISFFLNTTIIPFSLFLFNWQTAEEDDLIRNILTLFLISNFISPFISLYVQPKYLYKLYQRRKIKKQGKQSLVTQIEAHQHFEKVQFQLNSRYGLVLQKVTNCIFYAAVFPVGVIITFLGLIVTYWTSKAWLLKYSSIPKFSHRLGKLIINLTTLLPCIFMFGFAANLNMFKGDSQIDKMNSVYYALGTIPISLLLMIFGNNLANKFVKYYLSKNMATQSKFNPYDGPDYKQLNPTTFLHQNLQNQIQNTEGQTIFDNLLSYVIQRQIGGLRRDSATSHTSSIKSYSEMIQRDQQRQSHKQKAHQHHKPKQ